MPEIQLSQPRNTRGTPARNDNGLSRRSKYLRVDTPAVPVEQTEEVIPPPTIVTIPVTTTTLVALESHGTGVPWTGHTVTALTGSNYGELTSSSDEAWYRLASMAAGAAYHFGLSPLNRNELTLTVYNSSGNIVTQHGHQLTAATSSTTPQYGTGLYFIPDTAGTYHFAVTSDAGDTGRFVLSYQAWTSTHGDRTTGNCSSGINGDNKCRAFPGTAVDARFNTGSNLNIGNTTVRDLDRWKVFLAPGTTNLCVITDTAARFGFHSSNTEFYEHNASGGGRGETNTLCDSYYNNTGLTIRTEVRVWSDNFTGTYTLALT